MRSLSRWMLVFFLIPLAAMALSQSPKKNSPIFGNRSSPVEVYVFTDWFCPACWVVEPALASQYNQIMQKAKLIFIDVPIHDASEPFTAYNLSFMVKEDEKYFALRKRLHELAEKNETPTDQKVQAIAQSLGTKYEKLNSADEKLGREYFNKIMQKYSVNSTPTVVIVDTKTQKAQKLLGVHQITESSISSLIDKLAE